MLVPLAAAAQGPRPVLQGTRRSGDIVIDGRLDEADWRRAPTARGFIQRQPTPGVDPGTDTQVKVLYDEDALYVGIRMETLPGESPRGLSMQRDNFGIYADDAVSLKIDVRHDRRTTVGFVTNPVGTQLDYVSLENGAVFRVEYDAVWQCASFVDEGAWYAEFRLPSAALGAAETNGVRLMGFNVTREHNARGATDDWALMPPEMSPSAASQYGELRGVDGLGGGRPLVLNPYLLGGYLNDDEQPQAGPWRGKAGGNVRLRLAPDLWGEITILTDFAEVDVDDAVLNLSRFPITLPERRPFFLSGLDVFEMGLPGLNQLFFSRRIGLREGIYGGAKIYGRAGPVEIGLLTVVTEAGEIQPDEPGETEDAAAPAASWTLGRLRYNFGGNGHVGLLVGTRQTLWDPEPYRHASRSHYTGAVDVRLRSDDGRWDSNAFGAFTFTPRDAAGDATPEAKLAEDPEEGDEDEEPSEQRIGETAAWRLTYRGVRWQPSVLAMVVSEDLDPQLGFIRRKDTIRSELFVPFILRPRESLLTRATTAFTATMDREYETGDAQGFRVALTQDWETRTRWVLKVFAAMVQDVVDDDFELGGQADILPRTYTWGDFGVRLSTPFVRNPSLTIDYFTGQLYDGYKHETSATFRGYLTRHFRYELRTRAVRLRGFSELVDVAGDDGEQVAQHLDPFFTLVTNVRGTIAITPRLFFDLIGNYASTADRWNGVARARWRYWPGSDLIAVYQEQRIGGQLRNSETVLRLATIKLSHRFDTLL